MPIITEPSVETVQGVVSTETGNQRVVLVEPFTGTQLSHSTDTVECLCEDEQGNQQRCVAVMHFSDAESSPIPSQTGHANQFLKTTGSALAWDDALQNKATGSLGVAIEGDATGDGAVAVGQGSEANGQSGIALGTGAESGGDDSICIGGIAKDGDNNYNTVIGGRASASDISNVVLGYNASSTAVGAVALGYQASATENGTFVVGLSSDGISTTNYTVILGNGKINPAMFASVPQTNGNYRLRATVNNGVVTYSWVEE